MGEEWEAKLRDDGNTKRKVRYVGRGEEFDVAVWVMKGAQIGLTEGLIVNGICWIIANNPGNIMALSANEDLSREMIESRLDQGIKSCGIQHLIRPNTIRKRNNRTGDTSQSKEFAGGRLFAGSVQGIDKLGKQRSIKYGFFDDFESAPVADKDQGNIFELLQQRFLQGEILSRRLDQSNERIMRVRSILLERKEWVLAANIKEYFNL